jgi:PadR family transcriptional regulator PadR
MTSALAIVRGTLDLLVLKTLSWGPMHGFEITEWLEQRSGGRLDVEDSALYQALQRLEAKGMLSAEWGVTDNNRQAKYYKLTPAGRALLREQTTSWASYARVVTGILALGTRD